MKYNYIHGIFFILKNRQDATLREITNLVKEVNDIARQRNTSFTYSMVYPSISGKNKVREIGKVMSTRKGRNDDATLFSVGFHKGDYLIVVLRDKKPDEN